MSTRGKRLGRKLVWALVLVLMLPLAHMAIVVCTRIEPPKVDISAQNGGQDWFRIRAGVGEVYLEGPPERIGAENARLLHDSMVADESTLWADFERYVPWWAVRVGIQDYSRVRYRHLDKAVPERLRRELAAQALAFEPDPFASKMPTYQRMLFLSALYDISLPLEHSPLIGCTSFAFSGEGGHEFVARAFDFEANDVFDRDKVVYLVREPGAIPFASVAWPGFVGVVTGMNADGVVMVVHGGRAREPDATGLPVAFSLREALAHGHTTDEAVAILRAQPVMVSHIVFVADGSGKVGIVERAPGVPANVRPFQGTGWVTNSFEGPLADDPKNRFVRATTTSDDRGARIEALLRTLPADAGPTDALALLRDHTCEHDASCALGDRRAIDAFIATHGIVADATAHTLWVSAGPHLSGAFVKLDLDRLLSPDYDPDSDPSPQVLPADVALSDGRYEALRAARARSRKGAR